MKLRTKIYALAIVPVLAVGIIGGVLSIVNMKSGITEQAYAGMEAAALSIGNVFEAKDEGDYFVNDENKLCKGNMIISDAYELVDDLKKDTGFDVTVFYGDTRYLTTIVDENGNRQIGTQASADVVETVLQNGKFLGSDKVKIEGERYICFYIPIYQNSGGKPVGMIFLGEKYDAVNSKIVGSTSNIMLPVIIVMLLTIVIAYFLGKTIVDPINKSIEYLKELGEGKLGFEIDDTLLARKDVIGDMCKSIQDLGKSLSDIIVAIKKQCEILEDNSRTCNETADGLHESTEQISAAVQQVAASTMSQAKDAEDANTNMSAMGDLIEGITESSDTAKNAIGDLLSSMKDVEKAVAFIAQQTNETHESVEKIGEVTELISSIAFQTNILSLNASIEAARAGEYGRGFAVVSSEIQQLAQKSNESAQQIHEILDELRQNSDKAIEGMNGVKDTVRLQRKQIEKTGEVFGSMENAIGRTDSMAESCDDSEQSLNQARRKTMSVVHNVAAASEEIAASMEETAASVTMVAEMAQEMGNQANALKQVTDILNNQIDHFSMG